MIEAKKSTLFNIVQSGYIPWDSPSRKKYAWQGDRSTHCPSAVAMRVYRSRGGVDKQKCMNHKKWVSSLIKKIEGESIYPKGGGYGA